MGSPYQGLVVFFPDREAHFYSCPLPYVISLRIAWDTGHPETMTEPLAKLEAACREVGRDPATLGITALIGLWFPDLQAKQPSFFDQPLTGTVPELAAAMRGYADLGVQQSIFQCEPYTPEALRRLTEVLHLYRGLKQPEDRGLGHHTPNPHH